MKSKKLSKEHQDNLVHIGNNVASLWGASCYDIKPNDKEEVVVFYCVEHGEHFIAKVPYNELDDYND